MGVKSVAMVWGRNNDGQIGQKNTALEKFKAGNTVVAENATECCRARRLRIAHIAIIMDGNGRWAKQRHMPRVAGHHAVAAVRSTVERRHASAFMR